MAGPSGDTCDREVTFDQSSTHEWETRPKHPRRQQVCREKPLDAPGHPWAGLSPESCHSFRAASLSLPPLPDAPLNLGTAPRHRGRLVGQQSRNR